jgi:hypothetical protein
LVKWGRLACVSSRRSKIEARVVELCLIALLLLTIVAVASGRIGFVGEWAHVGGV